jgi:hypothetical protein
MGKLGAITFIVVALELFAQHTTASAGESEECDVLPCTENILFEVDYVVCKALIPGYEVDEKKAGSMTVDGKAEPDSTFALLMSRSVAPALGYPTSFSKNSPYVKKLTPNVITIRVENGQFFANEHALQKTARDHIIRSCRRYEATRA